MYKSSTVLEVARGIKAFLRLDAGLTRGEVPDSGQGGQDRIDDLKGRVARKDRRIAELQENLADLRADAPAKPEPGADANGETQQYGLGLTAGSQHYRAWVGPPERYDLISAIQVSLLLAAGLRENHRLVDVGCGSLRAGRMLIPYLRPGCYFGVEPNEWVVEEGIEHELGRDLVRLKQPTFRYVDDFSVGGFGVDFDFALAQSIFTHTYPDLALTGLRGIAEGLAPEGKLFANFMESESTNAAGNGWLYPGCVPYTWEDMRDLIEESGLVARLLGWTKGGSWGGATYFVAAHPGAEDAIDDLSRRIQPPLLARAAQEGS
ncbi:MAG: class I SAM-dependent methyltransferase [Rubrobacteraceae bacterium]